MYARFFTVPQRVLSQAEAANHIKSRNLELLSQVDFDVLKLDKSLVGDVDSIPKARTIVETIMETCIRMGISVVAEGIKTVEQLGVLRACGVEPVQGFLFSRPVPIEEYEKKYLSQKGVNWSKSQGVSYG